MVRIDSAQRKFAAADQAPAPKDPDQLPQQVSWDLKQLREHFSILKTSYDPLDNQIVWLVEARRAFSNVYDLSWKVRFYDSEGARLADGELSFGQRYGVLEGERQRMSLRFDADLAKQARRLIRLDRDQSKYPAAEQAPPPTEANQLPQQVGRDIK